MKLLEAFSFQILAQKSAVFFNTVLHTPSCVSSPTVESAAAPTSGGSEQGI